MIDPEFMEQYMTYSNKKIYRNLAFMQRYIPYMLFMVMSTFSLIYKGRLELMFLISPTIYYIYLKSLMIIIERKLIKNIENYIGILILLLIILIKNFLNYSLHSVDQSLAYVFPMSESQYIMFTSWLFMRSTKYSSICEILNKVTQILINYYCCEVFPDSHTLVDMFTSSILFIILCYIMDEMNFKVFLSLSMTINDVLKELSKGMDNINENFIILNIENDRLSLYHASDQFEKYFNKENQDVIGLLERFISEGYRYKMEHYNNEGCSLIRDLNSYVKKNNNNMFDNNNYERNVYFLKNENEATKYYEVKYTIFSASILRREGYKQKSILLIINSIDESLYQMKNQGILDFGNSFISSLTNELKDHLAGLYGQLYLIQKECIKNATVTSENIYDKSNLAVKKYLSTAKYMKSKLNLLIYNHKIYSQLNLKLNIQSKIVEIHLSYLLRESFKILYPLMRLNSNKLDMDISSADYCLARTDPKIFKTIIKNIILLIGNKSKYSNIEIKVLAKKRNKNDKINNTFNNGSFMQLDFIVYNHTPINPEEQFQACSLSLDKDKGMSSNMLNILNTNNKNLSKQIKCEYNETYEKSLKILKYSICLYNFILEDHMIADDKNDNCSVSSCKYSSCSELKNNTHSEVGPSKIIIYDDFLSTPINMFDKLEDRIEEEKKDFDINNYTTATKFDKGTYMNKYVEIINKSTATTIQKCGCYTVLIVDDDQLCINYLSNVVKSSNQKYELAYNGQEAIDKIKDIVNSNCHLCNNKSITIFMDIHMPVMNGVDSARLIDDYMNKYGNSKGYICRLYFISANLDTQFIDSLKNISIYEGFYNKPIKRNDLIKVLNSNYLV